MSIIFKSLLAATLLLIATGAHAQDAAEARALAQWPKLARRDGHHLLVMNHGGGRFSTSASVFLDGVGDCQAYRFTGAQRLFDGYTRRLEPVAQLTCTTPDGDRHALVRSNGQLLMSDGGLTASADGHYVFIEKRHETGGGDNGVVDMGMAASIESWTAVGGGGPYTLTCTGSRPEGAADFRATCIDPANGRAFDARFASARPEKPDGTYKPWKVFNLSDPSDTADHLNPNRLISISNGGDPFVSARSEAAAIAEHPGLVRRDGAELVVLDNGRDARRMRDEGDCVYWFFGKNIDLFDARKSAKAPVAEIYCQRGEFQRRLLAPAYAEPLVAGLSYVVGDDGRTVMISGNPSAIIDWQSRKVLLQHTRYCDHLQARGNDHFSGTCRVLSASGAENWVLTDFDRGADGAWTATEHATK
jgi:hypothetical protein